MDKRIITLVVLAASAAFGWFISTNYAEREAVRQATVIEVAPEINYESTTTTDTTTNLESEPATPVDIAPIEPAKPVSTETGGCYIGGCSSQICSDSQEVMSTCEWRDSYACYREATCERQTNGSCGWTESTELSQCLANPDSTMEINNELNEVM
jgi:hypothetical protein